MKTKMKIGNLVKFKEKAVIRPFSPVSWDGHGVIVEANINKLKWVKIAWSDGIIAAEHVDDLEIVNENR